MSSHDVQSLAHEDYHLLVAPALKVAAELAAERGDPDLYNDMASMLALLSLVRTLTDCYLRERGHRADAATRAAIEAAPIGACVMALNRGELTPEQVNDCVWALETAARQLGEAGAIGLERPLIEQAWPLLCEGRQAAAEKQLANAARQVVIAVDAWERERGD